MMTNLDGDMIAALGGDDVVVPVVVDLVVVDGQVIAVVVGVEAVADVVVHLVVPPVSLLVPVRVDSEVEVVDVGIVDVAEHTNGVEQLGVAFILAVSSNLSQTMGEGFFGCFKVRFVCQAEGGAPVFVFLFGNAVFSCTRKRWRDWSLHEKRWRIYCDGRDRGKIVLIVVSESSWQDNRHSDS